MSATKKFKRVRKGLNNSKLLLRLLAPLVEKLLPVGSKLYWVEDFLNFKYENKAAGIRMWCGVDSIYELFHLPGLLTTTHKVKAQ